MRDLLCYVQPASSLLGALVVSALSDRVGRKPTLALAQGLQVAASVALLFAPSFLVFVLLFALQTCCSVVRVLTSSAGAVAGGIKPGCGAVGRRQTQVWEAAFKAAR